MDSKLQFFDYNTDIASDCGEVLDIEISNREMDWPGIVLEKGQSPHFYPTHVYTPYFYFALALEQDLNWNIATDSGIASLKSSPGDIWINPPKTPFTHDISEPCYFVILAIEEEAFIESCPLNLTGKPLQFLNNYNVEDETIKGIIELFLVELKAGGRNGRTYVQNLLSLLSTHYIQNYSNFFDLQNAQVSSSKLNLRDVEKVDQYISENISKAISVEELADLLGCSKYYFLREFKKLIGETPYQYLMNKRLDQARTLMSLESPNIAAIGMELGFNDQSHFTRTFKNRFGLTPGQFVKQQ